MTIPHIKGNRGTVEMYNAQGKLLGRRGIVIDSFSVDDYMPHLRAGMTLSLTLLPIEFDALPFIEEKKDVAPPGQKPDVQIPTTPIVEPNGQHSMWEPEPASPKPLRMQGAKSKTTPLIQVRREPAPDTSQIEARGVAIDMNYNLEFSNKIRFALAGHSGFRTGQVRLKDPISRFGFQGPKLYKLLGDLDLENAPRSHNFAKLTVAQFIGYVYKHSPDIEFEAVPAPDSSDFS